MADAELEEDFAVLDGHVDHGWFTRFAKDQGWKLKNTFPPSETEPFFEEIWSTADEKNAIHFVDDPRYLCRFLRVRGAAIRDVLFHVARQLGFYDDDELVSDAARADEHDEAVHAILRLGVGIRCYRPDAVEVYGAYLQQPDPALRMATIQAIAYHHWAEAQRLLAEAAHSDSDPEVRAFATPIYETSRRLHGEV